MKTTLKGNYKSQTAETRPRPSDTASTLKRLALKPETVAVAVAVALYFPTVFYGWTGWDTLTLIATASPHPLGKLMHGSDFAAVASFWRPTIGLYFWLMREIVGLTPWAYHVVNIALHGVTALGVARVGRALGLPWAGALFAAHPVAIENVPALSRGQDIFAACFTIWAVYALLKNRRALSVGLYGLGLLSKEIAIIYLPIALAIEALKPSTVASPRATAKTIGLTLTPAVAITAIWLLTRSFVLSGAGGYTDAPALDFGPVIPWLYSLLLLWGQAPEPATVALGMLSILGAGAAIWLLALLPWQHGPAQTAAIIGLLSFGLLPVYLINSFNWWYMYLPAVGTALGIAHALKHAHRAHYAKPLALALVLGVAWAWAWSGSARWAYAGQVNQQIFSTVETQRQAQPQGTLFVYGVPSKTRFSTPPHHLPYVQNHALNAYLVLKNLPPARIVTMPEFETIQPAPQIEHLRPTPHRAEIRFQWPGPPPRYLWPSPRPQYKQAPTVARNPYFVR